MTFSKIPINIKEDNLGKRSAMVNDTKNLEFTVT